MPGTADPAEMLVPLAVVAASGYLLGALPFGYLVARSKGVDIFEVGSRSSGATNVRRVLGAGPGNLVFVLDVLKGVAAAGWPLLMGWGALPDPKALGYLGLGFAILGHSFSCFTRFRGGKGVATGAGGLFVLMPWVGILAFALWGVVLYLWRFVSLASIASALSLPFLARYFYPAALSFWVAVGIAGFVIIRHRANISRLLSGTEKRFERRTPSATNLHPNP
jgi:glycerol-3-phosphate acyltransferase PlsY